jgi:hypothetical protein
VREQEPVCSSHIFTSSLRFAGCDVTKSEYQELVEFLGRKFTGVDARLDAEARQA